MIGLLLVGCAGNKETAPPAWVTLVDPAAWSLLSAEEDPFEDRPAEVECSALGYLAEEGYFEVDTDTCPYGTFEQPLLHDVAEGEVVKLVFWHLDLFAGVDVEAEAHLAVGIGSEILHEEHIPIPADSEIVPLEFDSPGDFAAEEPVYFHIHNHGSNSWAIGELEVYTVP